jgi:5'-phosphate synthase pdxT subunit
VAGSAAGAAQSGGDAVGVLAVQGSFDAHRRALARLGLEARLVRRTGELAGISRLIIPGGESTVVSHFLDRDGFREALRVRLGEGTLAALGTCAGAIMLGRAPGTERPVPGGARQPVRLGVAPVEVERNAYGRQRDSFRAPLELDPEVADRAGEAAAPFEGVFIRAPRCTAMDPEVEVLGQLDGEPVLVRWRRIVLATFHPELTGDLRVHRWFCERV